MRQSKQYAINGACLFLSFFFARVVTMPIYYCTLYSVHEYPAFQVRFFSFSFFGVNLIFRKWKRK